MNGDRSGSTSLLGHNSLEAVFLVSGVVDAAKGAVRLDEGVESTHIVTITLLVLFLLVPGGRVCYLVLERVLGGFVDVLLQQNLRGDDAHETGEDQSLKREI